MKRPRGSAGWTLRMKDLCERTGLPRPVVHFYIREGLVPAGRKTGPNTALYGDLHVERIQLVRELQHERFLPLKAIRALLEHRDEVFSPAQRGFLAEVKARMAGSEHLGRREGRSAAAPALKSAGLDAGDLEDLSAAGLLAVECGADGATVPTEDLWVLELWGQLRAAGLTRDRGFTARDLSHSDEAAARLVEVHARLLAARLGRLEPAEAAAMLDRALPLIAEFLRRAYLSRARAWLSVL
ncbi:MAG: MerR family transcriptional regulator [Deltaproteobacteria bacterium]|nr:MerR family transcriptional regulator [Deltaproteobacteria bacterium]